VINLQPTGIIGCASVTPSIKLWGVTLRPDIGTIEVCIHSFMSLLCITVQL